MTTDTTRRDLLRAPLAVAAPVLILGLRQPAWAAEATFDNLAPIVSTPCLDLFREHQRIEAMFQTEPDDGHEALYWRLRAVEDRLNDEIPTCMADLAVKVLVLTQIEDDMGTIYTPRIVEELEAAVERGPGG